jgi:outer membrane protein assembly factor BamB
MEPLAAEDPRAVGEFRLRARLGVGGMGRVFLGFSLAGRAVAVKVVHPQLARDQAFVHRFRQEVAAAQAVNAAYTAPVVAAGLDDDPPWLATVFVPGPSLAEAIAAGGPLPETAVWKLGAGLVESLRAIHAANLVHRDLKPHNVLLAVDGPRVIDFGISRALDSTVMTATGAVMGTPAFMSPEQAQAAPMGPASDVFSLGCLLAFAATAASPFGQGDPATVLYRIVHNPPVLDGIPGRMRELVADCLAKSPADRPALAQLAYAISAEVPPDAIASPASFWPATVSAVIRSYEARLGVGASVGGDLGLIGGLDLGEHTGAAGPRSRAQHPESTGVTRTAATRSPASGRAGRHAAPAIRTPAARIGRRPTGAGAEWPAGVTGAGAERPVGKATPRPVPPVLRRAQVPELTRRQTLTGLAGASAVGLAVIGWELSQGSAPRRSGSTTRPTAARRPDPKSRKAPPPGTQVWSFRAGGAVAADLAVADGVIYAASTDASVYALTADGTKIWSVPTSGAVYSGPAISDGLLYVGSSDHNVYALRASNGAELWNYQTGAAVMSDPTVANGVVYVGSDDHNLYALAAGNGQGLWAFRTHAAVTAQPVVTLGLVLLASTDDNLYALRESNGKELWGGATGGPVSRGPVVVDGIAYLGSADHHVYAIHARGGRLLWSHLTRGPVNCDPAVADGVVYVGSDDHHVYALRASNGAEIWKYPTGNMVRSGPVVDGGVVYVGSLDSNLYALRATDGTVLWKFPAGGPITARAALADGLVYTGSGDGNIYAVQA